MRPADAVKRVVRRLRVAPAVLALLVSGLAPGPAGAQQPTAATTCKHAVYLTIDTGHMGVAEGIAEVLERQGVRATFFLANEPTQPVGGRPAGTSLDAHWASWWKRLSTQGHDVGSHTWDHVVWQKDLPNGFRFKPTAGNRALPLRDLDVRAYCEQLRRPAVRWREMTGQPMRALFRAPGGKTSPALLKAAQACGFRHVPWSPAGFLGDELPSERWSNDRLLRQALQNIREGDILLMHLGIWSRQDPWAPAVLEPLIEGLKRRGLCFATLRDHPDYRDVSAVP